MTPWGDDWDRSSMTASSVMNLMAAMAPRQEGEDPLSIPQDAFVPFRKHKSDDEQMIDDVYQGLQQLKGLD